MAMYNLIEYSKNFLKTSGSLWTYYRNEPNSSLIGVIFLLKIKNLLILEQVLPEC